MKLHTICSKDDQRPSLQYVKITRSYIVATDAHILITMKPEAVFSDDFIASIPEDGILIHREDWQKLYTAYHCMWDDKFVKLINKNKRNTIIEPDTEVEIGKYPNWEAIIPNRSPVKQDKLGVNAKLLGVLQDAVPDTKGCKLTLYGITGAIMVSFVRPHDPDNTHDIRGLIMPVLIED